MILFCANDAGGAKELIPVIQEAEKAKHTTLVLASNVTKPIFEREGLKVGDHSITSTGDAEKFLKSENGTAVIV